MTIYWTLFFVPFFFLLIKQFKIRESNFLFCLYAFFLIFVVGFRDHIGGDWNNYIASYAFLENLNFIKIFTNINMGATSMVDTFTDDIGFKIIYWFSINYFNGIYTANFICASIFAFGLIIYSKKMPYPWLAIIIATPYLIVVVAQGYTRQAAAVGFLFLALQYLLENKVYKYIFILLIGSLFHKTVLVMLPFAFFNMISIYDFKFWIISILLILLFFLFDSRIATITFNFLSVNPESAGARIRVLINVMAAIVFIYFYKNWHRFYKDANFLNLFFIISIISLFFMTQYSAVIDRISIYFIPLQILIFARVPVLINNYYIRNIFVLTVIFCYGLVMFVYLNFGVYRGNFLPYNNYFFN